MDKIKRNSSPGATKLGLFHHTVRVLPVPHIRTSRASSYNPSMPGALIVRRWGAGKTLTIKRYNTTAVLDGKRFCAMEMEL
jgi:hypothetical protein